MQEVSTTNLSFQAAGSANSKHCHTRAKLWHSLIAVVVDAEECIRVCTRVECSCEGALYLSLMPVIARVTLGLQVVASMAEYTIKSAGEPFLLSGIGVSYCYQRSQPLVISSDQDRSVR